jgi:hypothetical protein
MLKRQRKNRTGGNRVKTTLFAATFVLGLTLSAMAAQKPQPSQHLAGDMDAKESTLTPVPPVLCDPCLFYGGNLDVSSPNAVGLSDEDTLLIAGSSTYGNFNVPSGMTVTVTGVLFNVQADANFDPLTGTYDIRQGVSEGNGGTDLANGSGSIQLVATGRNLLGLNEYSLVIQLSSPLTLSAGDYWFNLTPTCTNGSQDGSCSAGRMFVSNVTDRCNDDFHGMDQSNHQIYLNSVYFGRTFANWCDSEFGLNSKQCNRISFGVLGYLN